MELSTVSTAEVIQLYSSFIYATTDALNCSKTRATKEAREIRHNCNFKHKRKIFEVEDITWYSCLCRFKHPNFNELMIISKHYEKGIMPDGVSILDQPSIMIERLEVLDHLKNLHKEQQHKEQERKNNGGSKRPDGVSSQKKRR